MNRKTNFSKLTKICALITVLFGLQFFASAQTQVYTIPLGNLINCPSTCATNSYYSNCAAGQSPGFVWTDVMPAGTGVNSVTVEIGLGVECDGGSNTANLNGVAQTTFTSIADCACASVGTNGVRTFSFGGANYTPGAVNSFTVTGNTSCFGYYLASSLGGYARVTVNYGPPCLNAVESNPLFTAASACSNGTFRTGSGAYYDLAVAANTYYNFTWNNNGAPNISGFCATPQNGSGAAFTTNQTGWFSGSTTVLRVGAYRSSSTWNATSGIMTYRNTQPAAGSVTGTGANVTVCQGTSVGYTAGGFSSGSFNSFEYQWNTTGGAYTPNWQTSNPGSWVTSLNGASILYVRAAINNNGCYSYTAPVSTTVNSFSTVGTLSTAGPVNYCDAGGTFTPAVTVSGYNGSPAWQWGSSNGGVNNWVSGASSGTCCFPKKVSASDGNPDRVRAVVTNGACPAATSAWVLLQNRYNEAPTGLSSSASAYCSNAVPGTITLTATFPTATAILGTVEFATSCGGTPVASVAGNGTATVAATITAPSSTTTYYVRYNPGSGTGCSPTACVSTTVTVSTLPVATAGTTINSCTGTGAITMSGATGTGSFSAATWSGGTGTWVQNINPALATFTPSAGSGSFTATLTLTGSGGCGNSTSTRTINWATAPVATAGATINSCTGTGAITMSGATGTGSFSAATWSGGTGTWVQNINPALATFTPSAGSGSFTATLTLTGINGCGNSTSTRTINWGTAPVATAGTTINSCTGTGAITMSGATGTGSFSAATWSGGTGTWVQNINPALATFTPSASNGTFTATLTLTGINGCGNSTSTRTINWGTAPVATAGTTINSCTGTGAITMTGATGTGSFSAATWSGGTGTWVQNINPALATFTPSAGSGSFTATLTLTGINGCGNSTSTRTINWGTAPVATAGTTINSCTGTGAITMTGATGTGSFSAATWSGGTGTWVQNIDPALATFTPSASNGTFTATLTLTGSNGCGNSTSTRTINWGTAPVATAGTTINSCTGTGAITMSGATGTGSFSAATWSGGTGTWVQNINPALATFTPSAGSGSFTATLTLTGSNGCGNSTSTRTINWGTAPVATAGTTINSCTGTGAITMTGATGTGSFSAATWSGGTGTWVQNIDPALATFTPSAGSGSFTATLTLTGINGCGNSTSTRTINWGTAPVATAGTTINSCTGTGAITMTGATGTGSFSAATWSGGTGTWVQNINPALATFTPSAGSGTFTATLTLTGSNGCGNSTSTRTINWGTAPVATAGATINSCTGTGAITMTGATGTGTFSAATWSGGTGTWSQNINPALATFTPSAGSGSFTATLTLTGSNGCGNSTSTRTITWNSNITGLTASVSPNPVCEGTDFVLTSGVTTGVVSNWVWSGPNGYNSTAQSHIVYGADESIHEGVYTISATNSCGTVTATTAALNVHRNVIGLTVDATPTAICVGSDLQLTASYFGSPLPSGDVTWSWTNSNASFSSSQQNPINSNIQLAGGGIYYVSATNACGVQVASGPTVQVDTPIIADADINLLAFPGPDPNVIEACGTLIVNLQGNNPGGSAIAQWSLVPNVLPNSGSVISYSPNDQSSNVNVTYSQVDPLPVVFRWTITNGVCPPSESDVRVIFDPAITANTVLAGCSFTSSDSILVQVSGAGGSGTLSYGAPSEGELRVDINANNKAFTVPMDGASHNFTISDAFCSITQSVTAPNGHPMDVAYSGSIGTSTATCNQADFNKWTTYSDNTNNAILAINDNGQDLGEVNVTVYKDAAIHNIQQSLSADNCQGYDGTAMQRHFMITAGNTFSNPVDVRLYFTEAELQALITASQNNDIMGDICSQNDNIYDMGGLYVTKYTGSNEDGDYTNNSPSGLYKVYGDATALPTQPDGPLTKSSGGFSSVYNGAQTHNYVQLSVSEFSELWLHGSQNGTALPVEMLYIEANTVDNSYIQVKWATIIEINNNGFQVERSTDGADWTAIGWVDGNNNATVQHNYSYNDNTVAAGIRYYYRLKQIDNDGEYEYTGIVSAIVNSQTTFAVKDFVPNPAISVTSLVITSSNEQEITVEVYNIIGEKMISGTHQLNKGSNMISFGLDNLAAGTYTAVVSSANEVYSKKLAVTK